MLNERKVKLMTKLAMYEKDEGKHFMPATKFFAGDYISWNMIKSVIAITVVYFLGLGIWLIYNIEQILENIATLDYFAIIRYAVMLYIILLIGYSVISYIVYTIKYRRIVKSLEKYDKGLKALAKIHVEEAHKREELGGQKDDNDFA